MSGPTKLQRHLDIIAYLVGRRLPVAVEELMENIPAYAEKWINGDRTARDSVRRMFERDKDELRAAGIPLKTIRYRIDYGATDTEGYIIERRDFYLPYLKLVSGEPAPPSSYRAPARVAEVQLRESDAPLALEALRRVIGVPGFPLQREARSAFRKLAFDLDPDAFGKDSPVVVSDPVHSSQLSKNLKLLSDALFAKKRVRFAYRGIYRGQETQREVFAYALLYQGGNWYLIGFDRTRDDIRVFRVDRIHDLEANKAQPNTPDYTIPQDFSVQAYTNRRAWELGEEEDPVTAVVLFRFPLSLWAQRNEYGTLLSRRDDGSELRSFTVRQLAPFARWILSMQGEAEIVSPESLREEVAVLARRVAQAHGGAA